MPNDLFQTPKPKDKKPHHSGHRQRLRDRFIKSGPDALADYELLELILFLAIPRRDVKPLAKDLIEHFGSFNKVFHASASELMAVNGISENTATAILSIKAAALRLMKQDLENKPILSSWAQLIDYCSVALAHEKEEQFRVLYLNRKNHLLSDEILNKGTVDQAAVYPREVVKRGLDLGASAMILVHNHPSGDSSPSEADVEMTQSIIDASMPMGLSVHDHIIISKKGHSSLRNAGLM